MGCGAMRRVIGWVSCFVVAALLGVASLYALVIPGLSSARTEAPAAETLVATWLLHQSVPNDVKSNVNPLGSDPADVTAGRDLYRRNCELCHAYDGSGKTSIGAGEYPHPPALASAAVKAMPDGELFYHIRNGIRNTAMPAWGFPDRDIWQLVAFLRDLPKVAALAAVPASTLPAPAQYVGSAACKGCHEATYARWSKSRIANVVRDPREHPDAIIAELSNPDP